MKAAEEATLLRIYVGQHDRHGHHPLYEAILREARNQGIAGATVLRGVAGFGADSHWHAEKLLTLSEDLPLVVEIVDREEKIQELLPFLDEVVTEGLVTMERVRSIRYRGKG
jgi:hypothetical protein